MSPFAWSVSTPAPVMFPVAELSCKSRPDVRTTFVANSIRSTPSAAASESPFSTRSPSVVVRFALTRIPLSASIVSALNVAAASTCTAWPFPVLRRVADAMLVVFAADSAPTVNSPFSSPPTTRLPALIRDASVASRFQFAAARFPPTCIVRPLTVRNTTAPGPTLIPALRIMSAEVTVRSPPPVLKLPEDNENVPVPSRFVSASIVTFPAAVVAPARVTPSAAFSPNAPSPLVTPVNVSPPADVSVFPAPIVNRSFAFVTLLVFGLKESDPTVVVMFESTRIPSIARTVSALKLLSPASNRTCADPSPFTGPTASIVHDAIPLVPEPASTPARVIFPPTVNPVATVLPMVTDAA